MTKALYFFPWQHMQFDGKLLCFIQTWLRWPWIAPSVFCDVTSPLTGLIFYGLSPRGWKGHRRLLKHGGDKPLRKTYWNRVDRICPNLLRISPHVPKRPGTHGKAKSKDTNITDVVPRYIYSVTKPTFYDFYKITELIYLAT